MYIATVPNRSSPPAILLRENYREDGQVKSRTLANLSKLPATAIEVLRASLKGQTLVAPQEHFEVVSSRHHGHVQAVLAVMRRLRFASLIASRPCRERDLVLAMVAARVLAPDSKLATTRWWHVTTLPEMLGVRDADAEELYAAMDWLLGRQRRIEAKLAARHLEHDALALYDLTSSYFEGVTCPLAGFGHNRDGKRGQRQVNFGLLTNAAGVPVSVSVFQGNSGDPRTLPAQVRKLREQFDLERFVLVGDRAAITQKQVDTLQEVEGVDWIGALRPEAVRKLLSAEAIPRDGFDERGLFELAHPDFPDERLIACRNPGLAQHRRDKRQSLLEATTKELDKVRGMVERGRLRGPDAIGVRVGRVIDKYKMAKHYKLDIDDRHFDFEVDAGHVAAEAALDGVYVVRTSLSKESMNAEDTVRSYKRLSNVEQASRTLKSLDLEVRPIRHRREPRVRSHIFLCMLAYYIERHMMEAWRPLLFADDDRVAKATRDPVAPAQRSPAAMDKVHRQTLDDGTAVHSFRTLLTDLSSIVRNHCRVSGAPADTPTFHLVTTASAKQKQALGLLKAIAV